MREQCHPLTALVGPADHKLVREIAKAEYGGRLSQFMREVLNDWLESHGYDYLQESERRPGRRRDLNSIRSQREMRMLKRIAAAGIAMWLAMAANGFAAKITAYLEVSPDPLHVGDAVTFSGCGYGSRPKDIYVELYGPSGEYGAFATHTEGDTGCFNAPFGPSFAVAGAYEAYVFPDRSSGDGKGTYNFNHAAVDFDFDVLP